jgi:uncharacterized protein
MYLLTDTALVTSASDLKLASECEFAFLRVLDVRLGWSDDPLPESDAMLQRAGALGTEHEQRMLQRLREEHGAGVVELDRPDRGAPALRDAAERTRGALASGAPVVYQAVFFDETDPELPFIGYADFLTMQPDGRYRVVDTKLSRHVRVTALLQLAAYHEQLQRLGIPVDDVVELVLGDDTSRTVPIGDIAPVFRRRRERMHTIIDEHRAGGVPVQWGDPRYFIDGRCAHCEPFAAAADDLVTVAGMRLTQRDALIDAGITTATALAASAGRPDGCTLPLATFEKLRMQARLQHEAIAGEAPPFVVIDPMPIAALPAPNPGDLFFDFEGDPLHGERQPDGSTRWGLDYLFGWVDADGAFDCRWAHSQEQEREALRSFLEFVTERIRRFPGLHVYHYAAYEKTHLLSIAARHGEGEAIVDDLLRRGVLVDLYPVVTSSLRVGAPSYSIKKLEPLYLDRHREGVTNAVDSIDEYARSAEAAASGDAALAEQLLDAIAEYNADDCRSTLKLRDWLLARPEVLGITRPEPPADLQAPDFEPSPLDLRLQELAREAEHAEAVETAAAYRMAAAAIDYHRREAKSFWWEHFARLEQPTEEWDQTRGVFVVERAEVVRDWHREGRQRSDRRILRLEGAWAPGTGAPRPGGEVFVVYGDELPFTPAGHRAGMRVARQAAFADGSGGDDRSVWVVETMPADAEPWSALPTHLTPGSPPKPGALVPAIERWGTSVALAAPEWPGDAMSSLLLRRPASSAGPLEPMRDADDGVHAVVASLVAMEAGHLAVQGPPGTGKTYLAAHVIAELVGVHHWRVGVTAQSHAVVEHVLDAIVLEGRLAADLVGKAPPSDRDAGYYDLSPFTGLRGPNPQSVFAERRAGRGYVLGGTAWDFANRNRVQVGQLDLLVVEEAGQFSLANTIAASLAASRILLLGDPQQLPQVSQGVHPAPVDGSALGHLIGGHAVLPAEFGYFLEESRRMDAAVAGPVSHLAYDGQLRSHPSTRGRALDGVSPGVHAVPVMHAGNATSSAEEAQTVVELIGRHLGRAWTGTPGGAPVSLTQRDVIVVTPYNAQVELIRARVDAAGFGEVEVGTVDRFQGREAVIAIVSLAASSAADVPRGLDFLLSRNRLNVSVSRAKWAAYLVHSPALMDALPVREDDLATLSRFITLVGG